MMPTDEYYKKVESNKQTVTKDTSFGAEGDVLLFCVVCGLGNAPPKHGRHLVCRKCGQKYYLVTALRQTWMTEVNDE